MTAKRDVDPLIPATGFGPNVDMNLEQRPELVQSFAGRLMAGVRALGGTATARRFNLNLARLMRGYDLRNAAGSRAASSRTLHPADIPSTKELNARSPSRKPANWP